MSSLFAEEGSFPCAKQPLSYCDILPGQLYPDRAQKTAIDEMGRDYRDLALMKVILVVILVKKMCGQIQSRESPKSMADL